MQLSPLRPTFYLKKLLTNSQENKKPSQEDMERASSKTPYARRKQRSGRLQHHRYLMRFSLLRRRCRLTNEEIDQGTENKINSPKEGLKD